MGDVQANPVGNNNLKKMIAVNYIVMMLLITTLSAIFKYDDIDRQYLSIIYNKFIIIFIYNILMERTRIKPRKLCT